MPSRYRDRDGRTRAAHRLPPRKPLPRWARDEIEHLRQVAADAAEAADVLRREAASLRRRLARAEAVAHRPAGAYDHHGVRLDASDEET